jgi:hypothetical protein
MSTKEIVERASAAANDLRAGNRSDDFLAYRAPATIDALIAEVDQYKVDFEEQMRDNEALRAELASIKGQTAVGMKAENTALGNPIVWWADVPVGSSLFLAAGAQPPCQYCGGTGAVHGLDGEFRGSCTCEAGAQPVKEPACINITAVLDSWEQWAFSTGLDERNHDLCKALEEIRASVNATEIALAEILSGVQAYLPPNGISKDELIGIVISRVDPWPAAHKVERDDLVKSWVRAWDKLNEETGAKLASQRKALEQALSALAEVKANGAPTLISAAMCVNAITAIQELK